MSKNKGQVDSSLRVELEIPVETNIIEKFLDLSLREILVLFFIMRYPGKLQISSLREEVNDYLQKDFSTSSFYNIIEKLSEKKNLIVINDDGKIADVTENAKKIIEELNRLTLICQVDFRGMTENLIPEILDKLGDIQLPEGQKVSDLRTTGQKLFTNTLVLNLEIMMDVSVLNTIMDKITDHLFILSTPNEFKRYQARGLSPAIEQSQIIQSNIREANDFFDAIIIIGFNCLSAYPKKMNKFLNSELKRVLKKGGMLFLVSDTHFNIKEKHFLVDLLNKIMIKSDFLAVTEKTSLYEDIEELGFKNPDAIEHNGMIVGWGYLE